jgi:hypothetical protein
MMKKRTMADVPVSGTFLTPEEVDNISQEVEKEIPTDPALQAIYIARRIMRREAEEVGLDYPSYLTQLGEKRMAESKANQQ